MTFSFIVNFDNTCILARCAIFNFFSYFLLFRLKSHTYMNELIKHSKNAFHWYFGNLKKDHEKRTTTTKLFAHYKNKWCQPSRQYTIQSAIVMRNRHTLISNNWGVVMSHACPAGHRIVQNIYFQRQDLYLMQNLLCKEHCTCARSTYIELIFNPATVITIVGSKE